MTFNVDYSKYTTARRAINAAIDNMKDDPLLGDHVETLKAIMNQNGCEVHDSSTPRLTDFIDTVICG